MNSSKYIVLVTALLLLVGCETFKRQPETPRVAVAKEKQKLNI